jgi:hypothetical protein
MTNEEELAALKKKVEELEAKVSPPKEEPFKPEPHQRYDPTEGMRMPLSALQAMVAAEPRGFMAAVLHDNRAPTGRPGMIPNSQQGSSGPANVPGGGTGWAHEVKLSNPPGTGPGSPADRIAEEFDRRDRAELARKLGGG